MALLQAFFDDSGTHVESVVTAFGGYVGPADDWAEIEEPWQQILAEYADKGVRSFHMTDCLAQKGEFALLDKPRINYLVTQLSKLIGTKTRLQPMFSAVVQDDWDEVVRDRGFLQNFPKPIYLCFEAVFQTLAQWSAQNANGDLVAPVFAHSHEYADRISLMERHFRARPWYYDRMQALAFEHPGGVIPLQAADLFAHQVRVDIEKRSGSVLSGSTYALHWATGGQFKYGNWFSADSLEETIKKFRETGSIY